jgi:hypothetical protein
MKSIRAAAMDPLPGYWQPGIVGIILRVGERINTYKYNNIKRIWQIIPEI